MALQKEGGGDCDAGLFVEDSLRGGEGRSGEDIEFEHCGRGGMEEREEVVVDFYDVAGGWWWKHLMVVGGVFVGVSPGFRVIRCVTFDSAGRQLSILFVCELKLLL